MAKAFTSGQKIPDFNTLYTKGKSDWIPYFKNVALSRKELLCVTGDGSGQTVPGRLWKDNLKEASWSPWLKPGLDTIYDAGTSHTHLHSSLWAGMDYHVRVQLKVEYKWQLREKTGCVFTARGNWDFGSGSPKGNRADINSWTVVPGNILLPAPELVHFCETMHTITD